METDVLLHLRTERLGQLRLGLHRKPQLRQQFIALHLALQIFGAFDLLSQALILLGAAQPLADALTFMRWNAVKPGRHGISIQGISMQYAASALLLHAVSGLLDKTHNFSAFFAPYLVTGASLITHCQCSPYFSPRCHSSCASVRLQTNLGGIIDYFC